MFGTEEELLITNNENIVTESDNIDSMIVSLEEACTCLESSIACINTISNSTEDNQGILMITRESLSLIEAVTGYPISSENVSLEEFSISTEDSKVIEYVKKIIAGIVLVYNKIISYIKKLITKLVSSNVIISSQTTSLIKKAHTLANNVAVQEFTEEECNTIYSKFCTVIAAYGDVNNITDLIENLQSCEDQITEPKVTTKAVMDIKSKLSGDNIKRTSIENEALYTSLGELFPKNSHRELIKVFLENYKASDDSFDQDRISVVEFYNNNCSAIILNKEFGSRYVNVKVPKVTGKKINNGMKKQELVDFVNYINGINANFSGFKKKIEENVDAGKKIVDMLKHDENIVKPDDSKEESDTLKYNIKIINQFTSLVPKLGNANVINYFHMLKNMLWLSKLMYTKFEEPKVEDKKDKK